MGETDKEGKREMTKGRKIGIAMEMKKIGNSLRKRDGEMDGYRTEI